VIESSNTNKKENSGNNEYSKKKEISSPIRRTYADIVMSQQKETIGINGKSKRELK
jgi:hypothetical protein